MVFSVRLAGLLVAGTILVVVSAAGSVKDGFPCAKDVDCIEGLHCLGKPESLRCKMKKPVGGQCGDPSWVCQDKLKCVTKKGERYGMCKATDGFPCAKDDHCVDGLHCLGKPESLRCKMKKPVGGQCGDPTWVCQDKLKCVTKKGDRYGTCVDPKDPKDDYDEDEPEYEDDDADDDKEDPKEKPKEGPCGKCPKKTTCLLGKCRKRVDTVEDKPEKDDDEEVEEYKEEPKDEDEKEDEDEKFEPEDDKKKKKKKTTPCVPVKKTCVNGYVCVGQKGKERCKKPMGEGESCRDITLVCKKGLACIGKGKKAICVKRVPYGGKCNRKTKLCACGYKCKNGKCVKRRKLRRNRKKDKKEKPEKEKPKKKEPCGKKGECKDGEICVGRKGAKHCKKPMGEGESCRDITWVCGKGLVCVGKGKGAICKKPVTEGESCGKASCLDGLVCVGHKGKEHCKKPVGEGESCRDITWVCGDGLKCVGKGKKAICRKASKKKDKERKFSNGCDKCKKGFVCARTTKGKKGCVKVSELGKACGRGKNWAKGRCPRGLSCRRQKGGTKCVKLLAGGDECHKKAFHICPRKMRCVGKGKIKRCRVRN